MNQNAAILKALRELVSKQEEDEDIFFMGETRFETYMQEEIKKLHDLIKQIIDANEVERTE